MNGNKIQGLRMFLSILLDLVSKGDKVSCIEVEAALSSGVATKLYSSYNSFFEENGYNVDNIPPIDEYFRQWSGIADGQEMRKNACQSDDGLILIIKLALNEIF